MIRWERIEIPAVRAGWIEWHLYSDREDLDGIWAIVAWRQADGMVLGKQLDDPSQMDEEFELDQYPGRTVEEVQKILEMSLTLDGVI